jgi:hypothetical protein
LAWTLKLDIPPFLALAPEVAGRYGHVETSIGEQKKQLHAAISAKDWSLVSKLSAGLANQQRLMRSLPPVGSFTGVCEAGVHVD